MLVFLALNGIELKYTQKELYETILNVASGSVDYNGLLQWVLNHQKLNSKTGIRPNIENIEILCSVYYS